MIRYRAENEWGPHLWTGKCGRVTRITFFSFIAILWLGLAFPALGAAAPYTETIQGVTGPVTVRIEPPLSSSKPVSVSLADPDISNGAQSDYQLFRRAIRKVRQVHATRLVIPKRVYEIDAPRTSRPSAGVINVNRLHDLTIEGNGAVLKFNGTGYRAAIKLARDNRIVLKNLILDWATPVAYPGILRVGRNGPFGPVRHVLTVENSIPIDANHPPLLTALFQFDLQAGEYCSSSKPNLCGGGHMFCGPSHSSDYHGDAEATGNPRVIERCPRYIGNHEFLLPNRPWLREYRNGAEVVATTRRRNFAMLVIDGGSSNISLEHIIIHSSQGPGIVIIKAGHGFRVQHCAITRGPIIGGSNADAQSVISTAADAMDIIATEGEALIADNDFGFQPDDGLNIRGDVLLLDSVEEGGRVLVVRQLYKHGFRTGDHIVLYDGADFSPVGRAIVASAVYQNHYCRISLENPVGDLADYSRLFVSCKRLSSSNYIIRNNTFHDSKNHGMVLRSGNGIVEGNRIYDTSSGGIQIACEIGRFRAEGPPPSNVVVRDNLIYNTNRSDYDQRPGNKHFPAAVMLYSTNGRSYSSAPVIHDIAIENNTIRDVPGLALFVGSARHVEIKGNTVANTNQQSYGLEDLNGSPIYITKSRDVRLSGNTFLNANSEPVVDEATTRNISVP